MKKTIIYLSLALVAFCNVSMASTNVTASPAAITNNYIAPTPLAAAIAKGDVDTVKKFIEYGADVNETSNGMTPLMIAARYNRVDIINLLIEKGARINTKDEKGRTALKYAEMSNAQSAVDTLKAVKEA